jgi:hypothetical protein
MADEPKLDPPIRAVIDAINRGDGKGLVAAFAKNGAVNDWGELHNGAGEIRKWDAREGTGKKIKLRVTGVSRLGGEILVLVEITNAEGEKSSGTYAFRLAGGKVASMEVG